MKTLKLTFSILLTFLLFEFSYAQDWANLKRFQKENTELTISKPNEHRVVFMGNSITEGWLGIRPEFFANKPPIAIPGDRFYSPLVKSIAKDIQNANRK